MPREMRLAFAVLVVIIVASSFCGSWSSEDLPDPTPTREKTIDFVVK